jgi:hypothetical protein
VYAATYYGLSISTDGGQSFTTRTTDDGLTNNTVNDVYHYNYDRYPAYGVLFAATHRGMSVSYDGGDSFMPFWGFSERDQSPFTAVVANETAVYASYDTGVAAYSFSLLDEDEANQYWDTTDCFRFTCGPIYGLAANDVGTMYVPSNDGLLMKYRAMKYLAQTTGRELTTMPATTK